MQQSQNINQLVLYYQGRSYTLNKPQILIGSDPGCDIYITDNPRVLPKHAQIITQDSKVLLQCLERGAGIWVNDTPTSQQLLKIGDKIALGNGNTILILFNSVSTSETPTQSPLNKPSVNSYSQQTASPTPGLYPTQNIPNRGSGFLPPNVSRTPGLLSQHTGKQPAFPQPYPYEAVEVSHMDMPVTPQPGPVFQPQINGSAHEESAMNNATTDATRYLCAAGHLDEDFQDYMLRDVIHEEHRALGESYGVDMLAVASWCKSGLRRINIRDGILTGILALSVLGFFIGINAVVIFITHTITTPFNPYPSSSQSSYYSSNPTYPATSPAVSPIPVLPILITGGILAISHVARPGYPVLLREMGQASLA